MKDDFSDHPDEIDYRTMSEDEENEASLIDWHGEDPENPLDLDRWALMGQLALGDINIKWGERTSFLMLMKAIMNDYWADVTKTPAWDAEHVDMVMSKLYYCWCRIIMDPDIEAVLHAKMTRKISGDGE